MVQHSIPLEDKTLILAKQYRHAPIHREITKEDIAKKLKDNIIEPSSSPLSAPECPYSYCPKEKSHGNKRWRLMVDLRRLNSQAMNDSYTVPTSLTFQLGNYQYFQTFDLASEYYQILLKPEDKWTTAFSIPNGHWQFVKMPMELASAPAKFQRMMEKMLRGLQVYAKNHERKLKLLFERLQNANLKLQPEKVQFLKREVALLGYVIRERRE